MTANIPPQIAAAVAELAEENPPEDAILITRAQLQAIEWLVHVARCCANHLPREKQMWLRRAARQVYEA